MEERAVEVPFYAWKRMLDVGLSGRLPKDAKLVEVFWKENGPGHLPSVCFAFVAEDWDGPEPEHKITSPRTAVVYPLRAINA